MSATRRQVNSNINPIVRFILFAVLILFSAAPEVFAQSAPDTAKDKAIVLNNKAYWLYGQGRYEESIDLLKQAIALDDNVVSNYLLSCIYNTEQKYALAVVYGERAEKLDTTFTNVYAQLFSGYYGTERWDDATKVGEKAEKYGKNNDTEAMLQVIDFAVKAEVFSRIILVLFFGLLAFLFFLPVYKASKTGENYFAKYSGLRFTEILLVSFSVSCILWSVFFALSKWIWSFNPPIIPQDIVNYVRGGIFEHDGIQSFFLYGMMFVNLLATLGLTGVVLKLKGNSGVYNAVFTVLLLVTAYYMFTNGFFPPLASIDPTNIFLPMALALLGFGLYYLYLKNSLLAKIGAVLLICFTGLIALGPSSTVDFIFLLSPALRVMHGFKISEIYFQYDLYLSFLVLAWIKMGNSIDWFPYLGQLSYFLFFLGAFFFSDNFFKTKGLSVIFIVGLLLMRFYSVWADNPTILQVTPMRLDLWIILLLIVGRKGVHHWLLGVFMGLLVLFHRNLGLIYLMAFVELITIVFILDVITLITEKTFSAKAFIDLIVKHLKLNGVNLGLVVSSIALCFILFHEFFSKSALLYQKLGIGLKPISHNSFYSYITVLLGCLISFIFYFRQRLGSKYTTTALYIVLLVIGNSMYFFGRSHENNILNISGILVIAAFTLFDMLIFLAPEDEKNPVVAPSQPGKSPTPVAKNKKKTVASPAQVAPAGHTSFRFTRKITYLAIPVIFVFFVGYAYSVRITEKVKTQVANFSDHNFAFPLQQLPIDTASVRVITHNSSKVYVIDFWYDSYYYYYNGYSPMGFFSPCQSWVYKKDLVAFLQDLLNKGYYIVYDIREYNRYVEYFACTDYNHSEQRGIMVAISKENNQLLLPVSNNDLLHIAVRDTLASNGLDYLPIKLKDEFSVQVVMDPFDNQPANATILDNLTSFDGAKGITLRLNATNQNQFVFGMSNGTGVMPNNVFILDYNRWHYLAITVNKEFLKVYDNGKLIGNVATGGLPVINSEGDIVIGNQGNLNSHFRGFIREVKICNGSLSEADINGNLEKLKSELSTVVNSK